MATVGCSQDWVEGTRSRMPRSGIKRQDHTEIERIGLEGGVERSGAGEDSSWNGLIVIVAWKILDPDCGGSDREWNATRVAQGSSLSVRGRDKREHAGRWERQRRNGRIPIRAVDGVASTQRYQSACIGW